MFGSKKKKIERQEAIKDLAYNLGGKFYEGDEFQIKNQLLEFNLFKSGHSKKITNLIHLKDDEKEISIFDYAFVIQAGNTPVVYKQSVFFINSKKLALPIFQLKPETFFNKVGSWLGIEDIDFESHPKFSDQYYLKGENEDYIRSMFNPDILNFFTIEKKWNLEGIGYYMIFYKSKKLLGKERINNLYHKGMDIYQKIKIEKDEFLKEK